MELVTDKTLEQGVEFLCAIDEDLKSVIVKYGNPPLWNREPGFATLLRIILEQQVSLASAAACYNKLDALIERVTPENYLHLSELQLRKIGFSRQKSRYVRNLAELIVNNQLDLEALVHNTNEEVDKVLISAKGIGRWTIDIYLLMALQRQDVWPRGDLALVKALKNLKKIPADKNGEILSVITQQWKPWRSVAARILWHYYLSDS